MAQKPNFLKKLISTGLVTASTVTMLAVSGSAMGAAVQQNRTTVGAAAVASTGVNFDQNAGANAPLVLNSVITAAANQAITFDPAAPNNVLNGMLLATANNLAVAINQNTTLGFISNVGVANFFNFTLGANQTFTLTGQGITAAQAAATKNAAGVVTLFNAGAAIANNDFSGLGITTFVAPSILEFNLANPGDYKAPIILGANATIANGANGTLNITSGFIQVSDQTWATINTINIADEQGLIINSNTSNAGVLNLQANGATINFNGADGTGLLLLQSSAAVGGATNFKVTGSLGGAGAGVIGLDTTLAAGQLTANAGIGNAIVGTNNAAGRANSFAVKATNANAATIIGQIYAENITLSGGNIAFQDVVDVGTDGIGNTDFETAASTVTLAKNSNFGTTDFGNTASQIIVPAGITLSGNFTGDASNAANTAGVITFQAAGTLAPTIQGDSVTNNVTAIESEAAGIVNLSGTHTAELRLGNAGSIFNLADGTVINGNVNQTALLGGAALAGGAITLVGSAKITGDIGNGGGGAALGNITLANDASKTLELDGANIIGANAALINFQANGGTLKLAGTANVINVSYNIGVAASGQGTIDASSLANGQTLTVNGTIGTIAAKNLNLGKLNIGAGAVALKGNAAINTVALGSGALTLSDDGANVAQFYIAQTTNNANQGTVNINPTILANGQNVVTLEAGSNLGSAVTPLNTVKFGGVQNLAGDVVLSLNAGANIYAQNITNTTKNIGSFYLAGGGTNIISGTIGAISPFNTVTVANATTAQFAGNAIFNGATELSGASTLQIGGNYTANSIQATDATNNILQFVNQNDIIVTLSQLAGAPLHNLSAIQVSGSGDVVITETVVVGGSTNITAPVINFTGNSLGSTLALPNGLALDNFTITSTVGNANGNVPTVIVTGANSIINAAQVIGSQKNIVGLVLNTDNGITVNAPTLYAVIDPAENDQGTVTLSGGVVNVPGTIYGLGAGNGTAKLKSVTVTTNYKNLGDTTATNLIVNDGLTYSAGGTFGTDFDGTITLGSANGNSNVIFAPGTNSTSTSTVAAVKANAGNVTYLGGAVVGNIGNSNNPVASVQFTGAAGTSAVLQGAIYSQATNFNAYNLSVTTPNVVLGGGTTAINGNINLGTSTLTFASGASTWGSNTSLTAQLVNGTLGNIVIANGATVTATATVPTAISIQDNSSANFNGTQTYTLIKGGVNFSGNLSSQLSSVTGSNRFVNYGLVRAANGDYQLTRTNNAANVITLDVAGSQFANAPGVAQNLAAFLNPNNTGDAQAAYNNLLLATNAADTAKYVGALVTDTSAAATNSNLNVAKEIQAQLSNRTNLVRYLGGPGGRENALAAPEGGVAAGDEPEDNVAYGGWVKPFYTDAHQKSKGGVAGYKARTTGGVIGFDTMANDNLMVGAAIGITRTDIKHQDYKKGDKTDVNGFSFSLYGAQQLQGDFFAQGSTIFSLNQVKNKSQRYIFDNNGNMSPQTASATYNNMTFGGNLMVGYDANVMEGMLLTPLAGLSYLKSSDESYKETGTTFANKQVNSKFGDRTDLIVGAKLMGNTMNIIDFAVYPEAHAFVTHKINGKLSKNQLQLSGQVDSFISQPDKTAKTSYNLGLSATFRPDAKMEYGIGYDAYLGSGYTAHQGTLKMRVNF